MTAGAARWVEPIYLDATALVKLFVPEDESDSLHEALAGLTDVIVSDLALTEMASALGRHTREQRLTREEARRLYREASNLRASSLHAELTPPIHRRAERLMLSLPLPLRALDALHLATVLMRKRQPSSRSIPGCGAPLSRRGSSPRLPSAERCPFVALCPPQRTVKRGKASHIAKVDKDVR